MINYTDRGSGGGKVYDKKICEQLRSEYNIPSFEITVNNRSFNLVNIMHRNLYNYRSVMNYKSLIYVICEQQNVIHEYKINDNGEYKIHYTVNSKKDVNFVDRMYNVCGIKDIEKYCGIIPLHFLLIDKDNNITEIHVDDEFIYTFCFHGLLDDVMTIDNTVDFIIPIGNFIWLSDAFYNRSRNEKYYNGFMSKVSPLLLDFAHLSYDSYFNAGAVVYYYTNYIYDVINFIKDNKQAIYKDLGIIESHSEFKYISSADLKRKEREKRKKELLEELQRLEAEDSSENVKSVAYIQ